ncbi:hypothetical protein ScPMuIL_014107 [Solemya velum]
MATTVRNCDRLPPEKVPSSYLSDNQKTSDGTHVVKDGARQNNKGRCGTRKLIKRTMHVLLEDMNLVTKDSHKKERKKSHAEELRSEIQESLSKKRKILLETDEDGIAMTKKTCFTKTQKEDTCLKNQLTVSKKVKKAQMKPICKNDKESMKMIRKKKKEPTVPVRKKREASLNAAIMVNIIYEKDSMQTQTPSDLKKKSAPIKNNNTSKCTNKLSLKTGNITFFGKNTYKMNRDKMRKQDSEKTSKKLDVKKKCNNKSRDTDFNKRKPKACNIHSKTKKNDKFQRNEKLKTDKFTKNKNPEKFVRRLASLNAEAMISAVREKKVKKKFPKQNQDTCKAARTHVTVTPKKWCPAQCRECVQSVHVPSVYNSSPDPLHTCSVGGSSPENLSTSSLYNSRTNFHSLESFHTPPVYNSSHSSPVYNSPTDSIYWNSTSCGEQQHMLPSTEPEPCDDHSVLIDVTSPCTTPKLQSMETSPYMKNVIPHQCIPTCPTYQCSHISGVVSSPDCQSYTLNGMGSLSSVHMMSYPACNSAFSVSCPHSIHHCPGCSASYPLIHATPCLVHHPVPIHISTPPVSDIPTGEEKKLKPLPVQRCISWHGWKWDGETEIKKIPNLSVSDGSLVERKCYSTIVHTDGDIIRVRDCVLLASGPKSKELPYVAKVITFWEHPETGEMMMHLLWYYRPEHTDGGRKRHHLECEIFASKHKDENSVACIDDKCYVLTFNEYCRHMAEVRRLMSVGPAREKVVPDQEEEYPRSRCLASVQADPESVFLCRQVYDFRQKRILKNPS